MPQILVFIAHEICMGYVKVGCRTIGFCCTIVTKCVSTPHCYICLLTVHVCAYVQWCSRKCLGTGAVQNISMVLFLEREH